MSNFSIVLWEVCLLCFAALCLSEIHDLGSVEAYLPKAMLTVFGGLCAMSFVDSFWWKRRLKDGESENRKEAG